jgi:hypothetical protein
MSMRLSPCSASHHGPTVAASRTSNNVQFATSIPYSKLLFAVLSSAGPGAFAAPHPTGNFLVFVSAVSSILHAVGIFRAYIEVLRILYMILYYIYRCTYNSRTFARLQRVPCLYDSVFAIFACRNSNTNALA